MITGFNTDINYDGVTYHVQTEDKGLKTPLILSLVYQGGTILASKRTPYEDLLEGTFNEKQLEERLNRQHKLICAAIRAGRVADLQKMTRNSAAQPKKSNQPKVIKEELPIPLPPVEKQELTEKTKEEFVSIPKIEREFTKIAPIETVTEIKTQPKLKIEKPILKPTFQEKVEQKLPQTFVPETIEEKIPMPKETPIWDIPVIEDVTIIEENEYVETNQFLEEEYILPPEAVEIIGDLEQFESLLENELKVKILGENKFNSGERKNINILVCRGNEDKSVENANVMIKVLGSDFRPLIYHAKADGNGIATVFIKLPTFRTGRAAILIRAMVGGEETELRRVITSG